MRQKLPAQENKRDKERRLAAEWQALLARHSAPLERGAKAKGIRPRKIEVKKPVRVVERIPSLDTPGGSTALKERLPYSGTAKGLAQMHKSNLVPVWEADPVDYATMRR